MVCLVVSNTGDTGEAISTSPVRSRVRLLALVRRYIDDFFWGSEATHWHSLLRFFSPPTGVEKPLTHSTTGTGLAPGGEKRAYARDGDSHRTHRSPGDGHLQPLVRAADHCSVLFHLGSVAYEHMGRFSAPPTSSLAAHLQPLRLK